MQFKVTVTRNTARKHLVVVALLGAPAIGRAATIAVPGDYGTIGGAIAAASSGDTITVAAGSYAESLAITKSLTLTGAGSASVVLSSSSTSAATVTITGAAVTMSGFDVSSTGHRAITVDSASTVDFTDLYVHDISASQHGGGLFVRGASTVTVDDAVFADNDIGSRRGAHAYIAGTGTTVSFSQTSFEGGRADLGGAIGVDSSVLVVADCVFTGNEADHDSDSDGGSLWLDGATTTITDTTFDQGAALRNGGDIHAHSGSLDLTDVVASYATAGGDGGSLYLDGVAVTISTSTLTQASAVAEGGLVYVTNGTLDIAASTLQYGKAPSGGGGIDVRGGAVVSVDSSTIDSNSASLGDGGGVRMDGGSTVVALVGSDLTSNQATNIGGAVAVLDGTLTIDGGSVSSNVAAGGGGIASEAGKPLSFDGVTFDGNTASGRAGAVFFAAGGGSDLTVTGCTFSENTAPWGAALYLDGIDTLDVSDSQFHGNDASGGAGGAALVSDVDAITAVRNLFCANAADDGGALYLTGSGSGGSDWTNNVFAENVAGADGGAIDAISSSLWVVNNTFVENEAASGGAVYGDEARLIWTNNIVAWSGSGDGIDATWSGTATWSSDYNDWYANTVSDLTGDLSSTDKGSNAVAVDPDLYAYSADGDCTNDRFWLTASSSLVDAGDPSLTDPDGSASDIGAYGGPAADTSQSVDADGDGYTADEDCDDSDASVYPGATEVCDALDTDEDCDGYADDDDPEGASGTSTFFDDVDGDGYGDESDPGTAYCDPPGTVVADNTDCDDGDGDISPGAPEVCDSADTDEDCDGYADDADAGGAVGKGTYYADADADGYGDAADPGMAYCDPGSRLVTDASDCDDGNVSVHPGAIEVCDPFKTDEDCDGYADELDPEGVTTGVWYPDADGDGYGEAGVVGVETCDPPAGHVLDATDCDDGAAGVNRGAQEICDAADVDEDCDGLADDADADVEGRQPWWGDGDGDGWGTGAAVRLCDPGGGWAGRDGDCDDAQSVVHPGALEVCDGLDNDCDGDVDVDDSDVVGAAWFVDADGDGYGDPNTESVDCDGEQGRVEIGGDCDDTRRDVRPGVVDVPGDGIDQDCSGADRIEMFGGGGGCGCASAPSPAGAAGLFLGLVVVFRRRRGSRSTD